jgi:hypothetical protein
MQCQILFLNQFWSFVRYLSLLLYILYIKQQFIILSLHSLLGFLRIQFRGSLAYCCVRQSKGNIGIYFFCLYCYIGPVFSAHFTLCSKWNATSKAQLDLWLSRDFVHGFYCSNIQQLGWSHITRIEGGKPKDRLKWKDLRLNATAK